VSRKGLDLCPDCGGRSKIASTHSEYICIRRTRHCLKCTYAWTTIEAPAEIFNQAKRLKRGLEKLVRNAK